MSDRDEKLQELILYVAEASEDDPDFGMTKLNKILFNADFTAYGQRGSSITDQEYQHLPFGPVPRRLLPAVRALEARQAIAVKSRFVGDYEQRRVIALQEPDLSYFTAAEIAIVNDSIKLMRGMSAVRVSDLSHEFPGWKYTEEGATIPYGTVFVSDRDLTAVEKRHGQRLAALLGD